MTAVQHIALPVVLHFALIVVVGLMMGRARFRCVARGERKIGDIDLNNRNWPEDVLKIGNNFDNQFQLPLLWYALTGLLIATALVDTLTIALSWLFLASRVLHSYIHVSSNKLPDRFYFYMIGFGALIVMWLWFALRLYMIG